MYYLVGVTHSFQCANNENQHIPNIFKEILRDYCAEYDIDCIAEEYSNEAETRNGCTEVICRVVANELNIHHVFIDPSREERAQRGIADDGVIEFSQSLHGWSDTELENQLRINTRKREQVWLDTIENICSEHADILVVMGANHIDSFSGLLNSNEDAYQIIADDLAIE